MYIYISICLVCVCFYWFLSLFWCDSLWEGGCKSSHGRGQSPHDERQNLPINPSGSPDRKRHNKEPEREKKERQFPLGPGGRRCRRRGRRRCRRRWVRAAHLHICFSHLFILAVALFSLILRCCYDRHPPPPPGRWRWRWGGGRGDWHSNELQSLMDWGGGEGGTWRWEGFRGGGGGGVNCPRCYAILPDDGWWWFRVRWLVASVHWIDNPFPSAIIVIMSVIM